MTDDRAPNLAPEDLPLPARTALASIGRRTFHKVGKVYRPRGANSVAKSVRPAAIAKLIGFGLARLDAGVVRLTSDGHAMRRRIVAKITRHS